MSEAFPILYTDDVARLAAFCERLGFACDDDPDGNPVHLASAIDAPPPPG